MINSLRSSRGISNLHLEVLIIPLTQKSLLILEGREDDIYTYTYILNVYIISIYLYSRINAAFMPSSFTYMIDFTKSEGSNTPARVVATAPDRPPSEKMDYILLRKFLVGSKILCNY